MVNVFLAIIMDAYGQVMGDARALGAATIADDFNRARAVLFKHGLSKKFAGVITSDRMQSVIDIAKQGDIMHGITVANSLTDLEMRALARTFIKRPPGEEDPVDALSAENGVLFEETNKRMDKLEAMLMKLLPEEAREEFIDDDEDDKQSGAGAVTTDDT